jgi:hypothetical protein
LLLKTDETDLDHVHAGQNSLANPFLETATVGKILLEDKSSLSFLDVLNPATVSSCFHEGSNEALGCSGVVSVSSDLCSIDAHGSVDVDVIQSDLHVFLEVAYLFFSFFLLLAPIASFFFLLLIFFLFVFLFDGASRGDKILEDLSILGGVVAMVFDFILVRRHVVGGVFVGSEKVKIAELVFVLSVFLVVFKQNQVSLLLHVNVPRVLATANCQDSQNELNRSNNTLSDGFFAVHEVSGYFSESSISQSAHTSHLVFLILFKSHWVPCNSLHFFIQPVQFSHCLDLLHLHVFNFGNMF